MRKFIFIMLATVGVVSMILTGCSSLKSSLSENREVPKSEQVKPEGGNNEANIQEGKKITATLYYASDDNSAIPSEKREIAVKDGAIMRAVIEALIEGPKSAGLKKALPDGTRILGIKKTGNTAVVDFSKEFSSLNGIAEVVERATVVNTLTEIDGVEKVKILVEGQELIGPSGKPLGEMSRFAVDSKGNPLPGERRTVTLYFSEPASNGYLVQEKREVIINAGNTVEKAVINELIKGPGKQGRQPDVPKGTKLLGIETKEGLCTVNLSQEFIDNSSGGTYSETMAIFGVVNSLTEIKGINKVQFLINSKKRGIYTHMVFDEPFTRDESYIQK